MHLCALGCIMDYLFHIASQFAVDESISKDCIAKSLRTLHKGQFLCLWNRVLLLQERCEVAYCGSEDNLVERARLVQKTKMKALRGHNAVFINCDAVYSKKPKPLCFAKAQEIKGNDIFAAAKLDPRRCYKPGNASSWSSSRERSGGSSNCDFPHKK